MNAQNEKLLQKAKLILENNWRGTHTVPSSKLYPHQWSWDSTFTAIGYSHYKQDHAQKELLSLFEGQWKNNIYKKLKTDYHRNPITLRLSSRVW
jgi:hypothetical protein